AAALIIKGKARVRRGLLKTPSTLMSVTALDIESLGIVRLSANGKLNLTGDGTPLTGDGLLDTTTNAPNSVEYTGHATSDVTTAGPAIAYHALAENPLGRSDVLPPGDIPAKTNDALPLEPASFTETSSLTLKRSEPDLTSAVIDRANGFAYFGTNTSPGMVVKVHLSDFTRVGALTLNAG